MPGGLGEPEDVDLSLPTSQDAANGAVGSMQGHKRVCARQVLLIFSTISMREAEHIMKDFYIIGPGSALFGGAIVSDAPTAQDSDADKISLLIPTYPHLYARPGVTSSGLKD